MSDPNTTFQILLHKGGTLREIEDALKAGADPNQHDMGGYTMLQRVAAKGEDLECAKLLLKYGAKVEAQHNPTCNTAFHYATINAMDTGRMDMLCLLLENGQDNVKNISGYTALEVAMMRDARAVIDIFTLYESGAAFVVDSALEEKRQRDAFAKAAADADKRFKDSVALASARVSYLRTLKPKGLAPE